MYQYHLLPESLQDSMKRYVETGITAGGFLSACLENDLMGAIGKADPTNLQRLQDIMMWIYWEAPHDCWGSKEKVAKWASHRPVGEVNQTIKTYFEQQRRVANART